MEIVKDIRDLAFVALVIALTLAPRIVSLYALLAKGNNAPVALDQQRASALGSQRTWMPRKSLPEN